jgi:DNA-binding MarR family transcriptional regulator
MSALSDPRHHDDLLNYQLKRLVRLGGAPAIRLCEGRYGVTRREWRLVAALVEDGEMAPTDLAKRAQLDQGCVSLRVKSLVSKGLVKRLEQCGDRRRAALRATPTGQELYRNLFPQLAGINKRILDVLSEKEIEQLESTLHKLTQRVQQLYDEGGGVDVRADRRLGGSQRFWRDRSSGDLLQRHERPL